MTPTKRTNAKSSSVLPPKKSRTAAEKNVVSEVRMVRESVWFTASFIWSAKVRPFGTIFPRFYSVNDPIVAYDRLRENRRKMVPKGRTFAHQMDDAVNQTVSRTILTSLNTFFSAAVLLF